MIMPGRICVAGIAIKEKLLHLLGGMGVNPDSCIATLDAAACPDFLHAGLRNGHVCGFLNESHMECINASTLYRKSGVCGSH
jgi:hypothetical protein